MTEEKLLHIILDNHERKLMKILDNKKEKFTYETKQHDITDSIASKDV